MEWFERMMRRFRWVPLEREQVLEKLLAQQQELTESAQHRCSLLQSNVARAESSWERSEQRVREVEKDLAYLGDAFGGLSNLRTQAQQARLVRVRARAERLLQQ